MDWDENFAYIAGRTEAGLTYGITSEELEAETTREERAHHRAVSRMTSADVINTPIAARCPKQSIIVLEIEGEMYLVPDMKKQKLGD